eukprot:CAMPEP_0179124010 /NCGR_PEP_ID=MMETSP0796-20121207/58585_1 /TAXON_ID=73915 /ORGANISM="Pyrodinium bahamense, Strain pbaha01" /LENGTH=370 /DNA_ID=CAMNT_0020822659 /DNA_START=51 /DNA_END=1163 /DNA_ORIENTATION=+
MVPCIGRPSLGPWFLAAAMAPFPVDSRLGMGSTALTRKSFDDFVHSSDKVLVDFIRRDGDDWRKQQSELEAAVRQVRGYGCRVPVATVDVSAEEDLAKHYVPRGNFPQLLWFLHGEPTQYHRSLRTAKSISDFVMALDRNPIVVIETAEEVGNYNRAILAEIRRTSPMYHALEVAAARHMDTLAVNFLDSDKDVVTWHSDDGEPVRYSGEATATAVENWVRGRLTRSETPPEPPEGGGPVIDAGSVVVVGQTFEELVLRKEQDVMLLVYAPWCGFSRKFFPTWEAFARVTSGVSHLVVAKMDGDRNSSPYPEDFGWTAYPTVLHVRAGERWPTVFHGNRTVANLVRFAEEHGSRPLDLDPAAAQEIEAEL